MNQQELEALRQAIRIACQKTRMIPSRVPNEEYARLKNIYVDEALALFAAQQERLIKDIEKKLSVGLADNRVITLGLDRQRALDQVRVILEGLR